MNFARWEGAGRCTSGPQPGAIALRQALLARWPQASDMGIYNCRKVRGADAPSIHGEGRAWDMGFRPVGGKGDPVGHEVVRALGAHGATLGVQTLIFDRTIWSARSPSGRPYGGVHPHYDHLHIELTREAGRTLTVGTLQRVLGLGPVVRPTLRRGARGGDVRVLQGLLRVAADGVFGPVTEQAVRAFQASAGLKVDGVVGPATWGALER